MKKTANKIILSGGLAIVLAGCGEGALDKTEINLTVKGDKVLPAQTERPLLMPDSSDNTYTTRLVATSQAGERYDHEGNEVLFYINQGHLDSGFLYSDYDDRTAKKEIKKDISDQRASVLFQAGTRQGQVEICARQSFTYKEREPEIETDCQTITVGSSESGLYPSSIRIDDSKWEPLFSNQAANRNHQSHFDLHLMDISGQPIDNKNNAFNVQLEIVESPQSGEILIADGGATGRKIEAKTVGSSGKATIGVASGQSSGIITMEITTDRSDGRVDNGIADPLVQTFSVPVVSDVVDHLIFFSDYVDAVRNEQPDFDSDEANTLDQQGIYQHTLFVQANDVRGNPIPDAKLQLMLIDEPVFQGDQGSVNPGTSTFNPNVHNNLYKLHSDANLMIMPEDSGVEKDYRLIREIERIEENTIYVDRPFPVSTEAGSQAKELKWVSGYARHGFVDRETKTDNQGHAQFQVTYSSSQVNRPFWIAAMPVSQPDFAGFFEGVYLPAPGGSITLPDSQIDINEDSTEPSQWSISACLEDGSGNRFEGQTIKLAHQTDTGIGQQFFSKQIEYPNEVVTDQTGCAEVVINHSGIGSLFNQIEESQQIGQILFSAESISNESALEFFYLKKENLN